MKKLIAVASGCLLAGVLIFVVKSQSGDPDVNRVVLPVEVPVLAAGPGREMYQAKCMTCHSARYVTMQPEFPRKVWEGEVTKMVKVFGAAISPEQMPEIVDYLVAVRGPAAK